MTGQNKITYSNPFSDNEMTYKADVHRYVLTEEFCRNNGIDLGLILETAALPNPSQAPQLLLDRVSQLVYQNIYNYGRQKDIKEYLLACGQEYRDVVKQAMFERLNYITSSGDLSIKSGAIITQGTRINVKDLIPSTVEEMVLRNAGLLFRGRYEMTINPTLVY
jgi:hypothetical protein